MALGKKVVATTKAAPKKETHPVLTVEGEDFAKKLADWNELKEVIKNKTADLKAVEGDIKSVCLDQYVEFYEKIQRNPETVKIQSEKGDRVMFVVAKKYAGAVDEDRATELREKYGDAIVEEKSEVVFNNDLLNKYSEKLEALIMSADFMTEAEKEELFVNKVTYNITSDAINEGCTWAKGDVRGLINDTNPVTMMKETR